MTGPMLINLPVIFHEIRYGFNGATWGVFWGVFSFFLAYGAARGYDRRTDIDFLFERMEARDWAATDYWRTHDSDGFRLGRGVWSNPIDSRKIPYDIEVLLEKAGYPAFAPPRGYGRSVMGIEG